MKNVLSVLLFVFVLMTTIILSSCNIDTPINTTTQQPNPNSPSVHTHSYSEIVIAPTCTENGYTIYMCECGENYKGDYVDATGHNCGEWVIVIQATKTSEGVESRGCEYCDYQETQKIDILPDVVYYSDIFYGYDISYLNQPYLLQHHIDIDDISSTIFNDYVNSSKFIWTEIETSISAALSAKEFFELMSDAYLDTSFNYDDAIDSANVIFAEHLLDENISLSAASIDAKVAGRIKKLINLFDEFAKNHDPNVPDEITITKFYTFITQEGVFNKIGFDTITTVKGQLLSDINNLKNQMDTACTTLDVIQAITLGMMMEDIRLDMLDDIIESCLYEDTLYEGMTRLRTQLEGGCASYIIHNYFQDEFLNTLSKTVTKALTSSLSAYSLVSSCFEVASWVAFDVFFSIPDLDDMLTQMVLREYATGFYNILRNKTYDFATQFTSNDVIYYQAAFNAYIAASNGSLEASKDLTLSSNEAQLNAIHKQYADYSYCAYIDDVKNTILSIPISERKIKTYDCWETETYDEVSIVQASDIVNKGEFIYLFEGAFNGDLSVSGVLLVEVPFAIINGNIEISCLGSMIIASGSSYTINGNLTIEGDDRWVGDQSFVKVEEGAMLTINGDTSVGEDYWYIGEIINAGKLVYLGNVNVMAGSSIIVDEASNDAEILVYSDLIIDSMEDDMPIKGGKVVFLGEQPQYIYGLRANNVIFNGSVPQNISDSYIYNIEVLNKSGIIGEIYLYGNFDLHGNPFEGTVYMYDGATLADGSDYDHICIETEVTLRSNIKANINISCEEGYLIIPGGESIIIDGNVIISGDSSTTLLIDKDATLTVIGDITVGATDYYDTGRLINNGVLICNGYFNIIEGGYCYTTFFETSKMYLRGDACINIFDNSSIIAGTVIFDGKKPQTIEGGLLNVPIILIENESDEGVSFYISIDVNKLFNHNGNVFDLNEYYDYTFVDFDSDGKLDNVDPDPADPNK